MKTIIKRIITILSCCFFVLPLCLTLAACGHTHEFSNEYTFNTSHHWKICTSKEDCDVVSHFEQHNMGEWKIETKKTCLTDEIKYRTCECGYKETTIGAEKGHSPSGAILYDDTHHWNECRKCDEKMNLTEHSPDEKGICTVCHHGAIVRIENTYFVSIDDAIDSIVNDGKETEIVLLKNTEGPAVRVPSGKWITFNLNTHTYTITQPAVGSTGTTTSGFQLLKDSKITFRDGTIQHNTSYTEQADALDVQILINNYANLTLDNMILIGKSVNPNAVQGTCLYTLSNNNGNVLITGETRIIADDVRVNGTGGVAFDLWYTNNYSDGVTVKFDKEFTGYVKGKIEYGAHANATEGWEAKTRLEIHGGSFYRADENLDINENPLIVYTHKNQQADSSTANISITKGLFHKNVMETIKQFKAKGSLTSINGLNYRIYVPE